MPNQLRKNEETPGHSKQSATFSEILSKWMLIFANPPYSRDMIEPSVWLYREALRDLTPEQLDRGFLEVTRRTSFVPTPHEVLDAVEATQPPEQIIRALPEPPLTDEEAKKILADLKAKVPCLSDSAIRKDGIVTITPEMRADHERKKAEALERFGKST